MLLGALGGSSDRRRKAAWHWWAGARLTLAEPLCMSPGCSCGGPARRDVLREASALPGRGAAWSAARPCVDSQRCGTQDGGGWVDGLPPENQLCAGPPKAIATITTEKDSVAQPSPFSL